MTMLGRPVWALFGTMAFTVVAFGGCGVSSRSDSATEQGSALLESCKKAADCEDGDPCTNNLCTAGVCVLPVPVIGCDPGAGGEGGASTTGGVLNLGGVVNLGGVLNVGGVVNLGGVLNLGGTLTSEGGAPVGTGGTVTEIACTDERDCADGNSCTSNLCVLNICVSLPLLDCVLGAGGEPGVDLSCSRDADCEEGHPCTDNTCVAGLCATLPVLGCCLDGNCVIGVGGTTQVEIGGTGNGGGGGRGGASNGGTGADGGVGAENGVAGSDDGKAGDGSGATGATRGEAGAGATPGEGGAGASKNDQKDEAWRLRGGSCAVAAPRSGYGFLLMLFGLGAIIARRRRRLAATLAAAPVALAAATAHAAGFAQDAYTSPVAPDDLMWTERAGSDPGHLRPFARLTLGFSDDPLVLVDANDPERELRVVDDQFALYGAFGLGFAHRAHLAVLMPLYVQSSSFAGAADNIEGAVPGDLGVDGRFTILDREAPLELALAATLRFPTGDRDSYASDGGVSVWPRALVSKQLSDSGSLLNLSVGPMFRPSNTELGVATGTQLRFTAGALVALTRVVGVTAEAAGSTVTSDPSKRNTPLEGALGGRLTFSSVVIGSTIGTGLTEGVGAPDWRWLATIAIPGPVERVRAAGATEVPLADRDADHDGIVGELDKCPNEAEDKDGFQDEDGCPEADNDGDGIPDASDKCPNEGEDKDGFQDEDGCPEADNDKDGLADQADKCPNEAEDVDHWVDEDGCPDPDNDGDGVLDEQDKCPNEPETMNGIDDQDGCPDLLRVEEGQIRTLEPIYFDYNKATIQARSEPLMLEMANLIRSRSDLGVIAVEGHTDNKGSAKYNLKLSQDRAAAVRAFLINAGVPEARVTAGGFGSERPLEDNKTEAGRSKNRRVEFHFAPPSSSNP